MLKVVANQLLVERPVPPVGPRPRFQLFHLFRRHPAGGREHLAAAPGSVGLEIEICGKGFSRVERSLGALSLPLPHGIEPTGLAHSLGPIDPLEGLLDLRVDRVVIGLGRGLFPEEALFQPLPALALLRRRLARDVLRERHLLLDDLVELSAAQLGGVGHGPELGLLQEKVVAVLDHAFKISERRLPLLSLIDLPHNILDGVIGNRVAHLLLHILELEGVVLRSGGLVPTSAHVAGPGALAEPPSPFPNLAPRGHAWLRHDPLVGSEELVERVHLHF